MQFCSFLQNPASLNRSLSCAWRTHWGFLSSHPLRLLFCSVTHSCHNSLLIGQTPGALWYRALVCSMVQVESFSVSLPSSEGALSSTAKSILHPVKVSELWLASNIEHLYILGFSFIVFIKVLVYRFNVKKLCMTSTYRIYFEFLNIYLALNLSWLAFLLLIYAHGKRLWLALLH